MSPFHVPLRLQGDADWNEMFLGQWRWWHRLGLGTGETGICSHCVRGCAEAEQGSAGSRQWHSRRLIIQPLCGLGNAARGRGVMGTSVPPRPAPQA